MLSQYGGWLHSIPCLIRSVRRFFGMLYIRVRDQSWIKYYSSILVCSKLILTQTRTVRKTEWVYCV